MRRHSLINSAGSAMVADGGCAKMYDRYVSFDWKINGLTFDGDKKIIGGTWVVTNGLLRLPGSRLEPVALVGPRVDSNRLQ